MKKSVLVLLLALVCFVTSVVGCSKSAGNPNSPSPVVVGGGSSNVVASVASWSIYPTTACGNGPWCDASQALRPNSEGRYELGFGVGSYIVQVVFNNPQVAGRVVQYRRVSAFSMPEASDWLRFGQTDPGTPAQYPTKLGVNVVYPKNAADPVIRIESTEAGPGLESVRQIPPIEIKIKFTNVS